ncbi:MAG: IMP dehydrogenase, partial [Alistipes sp.]
RVQPEGLTFDDVLLIPAYSEVLPREVSTETRFSRNIKLNIPIVSAAMDTVTEAPLAIALAREGGIGVIHKNMSIAEQAAHVRKVKRAENGMIYDPITISKSHTVGDALALMRENKIGGIPVIDKDSLLIGIVTNRDLRFQRDMKRTIDEVMTKENLITTHNTDLERAVDILLILLEHAGNVVSKQELIARVWPKSVVEDGNLRVHMAALRKALGDGQAGQRYIVTVAQRGYSFVAPLSIEPMTLPTDGAPQRPSHNLPLRRTRMIGRQALIDALVQQLPQQRFITLTGAG